MAVIVNNIYAGVDINVHNKVSFQYKGSFFAYILLNVDLFCFNLKDNKAAIKVLKVIILNSFVGFIFLTAS